MASRFRTERMTYRSVGAAALKPAFGSSAGSSRPDWSISSRSTKSQPTAEPTRSNAVEGVSAQAEEKPLKKSPSDSVRKRKDRRNLRERRHGTGVVILPSGDKTEDKASETRQTLQNTKQNESIGADEFSPSPSEVTPPSKPQRSSRTSHDDVDLDKRDKKDLIDLIEQLEKSLDLKTKEVVSLKGENQNLRDDNNALLRLVQVSSLKTK